MDCKPGETFQVLFLARTSEPKDMILSYVNIIVGVVLHGVYAYGIYL